MNKKVCNRAFTTVFDETLQDNIRQAKQVPVLINYFVGKKRHVKKPDEFDLELIRKIDNILVPYWFPTSPLPNGSNTSQPINSHGLTHVHHFYTKRNLIITSAICDKLSINTKLLFQSVVGTLCSKLVRYNMGNRGNGPLNGTLYVASMIAEADVLKIINGKIKDFKKAFLSKHHNLCLAQTLEYTITPSDSIDYVFVDPPFGANINYSELNYIWESWLKVTTNNKPEAIENKVQGKTINDYRRLMVECFKEVFRVLKPGHWMTVEFSNTKASVWNSIQTALEEVGFVVANVSALDKKQGSFKAVTTTTAVVKGGVKLRRTAL